MQPISGHPDDATLFDLIEGTLEVSRAAELDAHLARCAACSAFVDLARAGGDAAGTGVVGMPGDVAERLDHVLASAWSPSEIPQRILTPRRRRLDLPRLAPIAAALLLAVLVGTSVLVGDPAELRTGAAPSDQTTSTSEGSTSAQNTASAPDASERDEQFAQPSADAGAAEDAIAPPETAPGTSDPFGGEPQPDPSDPALDYGCIATLDSTRLFLPDGRAPQLILQGPLGMFVVCG